MLLEQSIANDTANTSFNPKKYSRDDIYNDNTTMVDEKSFSVSI